MERFAFEFSTKFKILYIQFEFGIFLSKIICQEFNMIKNKIKSLLNFDNNWDILPSILNAYFSNLNFENTYKFNLTVQIIQLLNQNPTLKN
ncbi:MAG: hypothetical protein IPJ43_02480 [Saprospiraceae bacterium]|nr:hypothetical protein [Saprospiraceae bacterium]